MVLRVNPNSSSCARRIDEVFQNYGLELIHFDIRYRDNNGNRYMYASDESSTKSIEKIDGQTVFSLLSTSLATTQSFDTSGSGITQKSLDGELVIADLRKALELDSVILESANVDSEDPPCTITFPPGGSYLPAVS